MDEIRVLAEDTATYRLKILGQIDHAPDIASLEAIRIASLGRKGAVSESLKTLGTLPKEHRARAGARLNELKSDITAAISRRKSVLADIELTAKLHADRIDVSLPVRPAMTDEGRVHPVSRVTDEVCAIYTAMGFDIDFGPDIETDELNFTALNFPAHHPARDMHDTFFLPCGADGEQRLLRTHTSPVQIRTMRSQKPPIRMVAPGRTYRCDSDRTHTPMFHQVEGLVVDETSHFGHLKWCLVTFLQAFFDLDDIQLRFRPSFFPFTEPSMEVDVGCARVGDELRIGGSDDWLEILGCGMVHPNVLTNCGIDPDIFQGFAWGMGIDRLAMLKYGMSDLRQFFSGDSRWARHYGFGPLDLPGRMSAL